LQINLIDEHEYLFWSLGKFQEFIPDEKHVLQKSKCSERLNDYDDEEFVRHKKPRILYSEKDIEISSISDLCQICSSHSNDTLETDVLL
jgi:hypothetical protein